MGATWLPLDSISVQSVQAGTEARPTAAADGMPLAAVIAVTVWLDAGQGQTITSDAGQADWYVYDNGAWGLAALEPLAVPPHAAGERRVSLGTVPIGNQRGRLAPILNGVTLSGATATLDILVTIDRAGRAKAA
jgi:hypothetical protein